MRSARGRVACADERRDCVAIRPTVMVTAAQACCKTELLATGDLLIAKLRDQHPRMVSSQSASAR